MPQATNSIALAVPTGSGGEIWLSMLQMTTENTADQIGGTPPGQRPHAILRPGEQQQQSKQAR